MALKWLSQDFAQHAVRDLWINGMRVPAPEVQVAEVHQTEYMHDLFVFQMVWPDVRALTSCSGWLVQCQWGMDIAQGFFYGYVTSAQVLETRAQAPTQQRTVQFTCLGATSIMQSGQPRSFVGMTGDTIAAQIVRPYHLALVADHHPYLNPSVVQAQQTDWQFLVGLARSVGYVLASYKVTVLFIDPMRVVLNTGSSVNIVAMESGSSNPGLVSGAVSVGRKSIAQFTNTVVQSVDQLGNVTQAAGSNDKRLSYLGANDVMPLTTRYDADQLPHDQAHAQVIVNATNRPERWPLQAPLFCKGDGRIRPGVVAALHMGENQLSGLWLVRSTVHYLHRKSYTMDVTLARDSTTNSPYPTPTITAGDRSGPLNGVAAPVVTNGKWTSVWSA
jgi:hypothetical protein